eukprot:TRINITY_DN6290_c0_g1_i1.p2 TRINITY_DN6290_c0_g1~~TRINITY_DN6290_c0_g1_i1.p2  ORF type:complete len:285 (+),score=93.48 TRINITY_DN6290_c0_g1_i1:70-855(+)
MPDFGAEVAEAKKGLEKKRTYLDSVKALSELLDRSAGEPPAAMTALHAALGRVHQLYLSRYDDEATWAAVDEVIRKAAECGFADAEKASLAEWQQKVLGARPVPADAATAAPAAATFDWSAGMRPPPAAGSADLLQALLTMDVSRGEVPQWMLEAIESLEREPAGASRDAWNDLLLSRIPHNAKPGEHTCVVCLEDFEPRRLAKKMPCEHLFHDDCLGRWLESNNNCPMCRFELPKNPRPLPGLLSGAQRPEVRAPARMYS